MGHRLSLKMQVSALRFLDACDTISEYACQTDFGPKENEKRDRFKEFGEKNHVRKTM